ncbi:L,D-transpeptidase [Synechococcus sp. RS9916]|uniref:L,D-transpeptidase n=1 Tax=Synechococcus sp. RS9916 TaxID=221359 RepID=UPI0000E53FD6|nr:L,D-transpeptidase [Synechococcus sp. RS9916]EAU73701.1 hypothetical protein RS9916_29369 [Synechococcus sp. RS9916]
MLPDRLSRLLILISAGVSFASPGQALTLNEALAIRLATPNETTRSSVAARSHSDTQQHRASPAELLAKLQEEGTSVLVLEKTHRRLPSTGDPIWSLRLEIPGQPVRQFDAVSGRANRQSADRDRLGSRAPLPAGHYILGPVEPLAAGAYPELGPIWIGIEPTFPTGRRVLGIHQDPSAGLGANSGTLGCIGLIKRNDLLELARQVNKAKIRELVVTN